MKLFACMKSTGTQNSPYMVSSSILHVKCLIVFHCCVTWKAHCIGESPCYHQSDHLCLGLFRSRDGTEITVKMIRTLWLCFVYLRCIFSVNSSVVLSSSQKVITRSKKVSLLTNIIRKAE